MKAQDGFTGKIGYVLAAAGSAVGLGNIWRFPYLTAKYGGAVFLLVYFILVLTFGYSLLIAENCIGRITRKGPIGAYRQLCDGQRSFLKSVRFGGWINAIVPLLIVPYYCVIGGWIAKYIAALAFAPAESFTNAKDSAAYFTSFITATGSPLFYFFLFVAVLIGVIAFGVQRGVERFNKILMPLLTLLIVAICVYSLFLPGIGQGLAYYLKPDFSKFSAMTVVAAVGQLFYSLSIAMGIMITYGSYMRDDENLVSCVNQVEVFDTLISFFAGLMIIPAVVAFGGEKAAEAAGPSLLFITMPQVFAGFPCGRLVGVAFFVLVLFAAATSAISLMETNVQTISQELKISRKKAIAFVVADTLLLGTVTVLGYSVFADFHPLAFIEKFAKYDILDSLDFISNSVLMPIGAIFTVILVVAIIGLPKFSEYIRSSGKWGREYLFQLCMTVFVIPCLLVILLYAIGIIK